MKLQSRLWSVLPILWGLFLATPSFGEIVNCNCSDACGCPDDDTSDTTQVTWCNGTTQMTCTCAGSGCLTGTRETCVAQTVCSGAAGPYEPCGGKGQDTCECGGSECQNGPGETCEAKIRCNVAPDPYKPCGGSTATNCSCQGDGCPTDSGKTCQQKNLCNARTGDYTPCGGSEDTNCGCRQSRCNCTCAVDCSTGEDTCNCGETPCAMSHACNSKVRCKEADPYKPCNDESTVCATAGCGAGDNCNCGSYCKGGGSPCGQ